MNSDGLSTAQDYLAYLLCLLDQDTLSDKEKGCIVLVIDELITKNSS